MKLPSKSKTLSGLKKRHFHKGRLNGILYQEESTIPLSLAESTIQIPPSFPPKRLIAPMPKVPFHSAIENTLHQSIDGEHSEINIIGRWTMA